MHLLQLDLDHSYGLTLVQITWTTSTYNLKLGLF